MASRELENSFIQRQSESSNLGELWQREKAKRRLAETALLESEKRFRATFETAAMAIAHISLDGQLLVVNPKLSDLLGYTSEELLNLTFDAIVRPDAITSASLSEKRLDWDELARSLQPPGESPAIGRELRCIRKDGSPIWVKISLSLVARKEEAENPTLTCDFSLPPASYAIAVIQDISDRISLEQELARQKQLFNAFFASAPVGLAILDDQLNYVLVNETLAEINGVSVEDHLGKNLKDVLPDCAPTLEPLLKNILLTGEPILDVENSGNLPGKSDVQTWISSQFAIPGEEGKPQGIGAVVVDITKRKQAEEALRKSEEQYRTLARNFPNGAIALFDSDMRYTLFEGTELTKIGLSKEFIEGKTLQEVFPPEMCAIVEPMYRAALMGTTLIFEAPYREQIYLWHILPISNDRGKILSGMAMSQNITLAKQIEQVWRQQAQIIDQLRLAVVKIDFAGVAIGWNKGAENLFGYQASEVIGQTISFIDSPESSEFWQQLIRQVLKKGTHELELKMQQKSGEDLFVLFSFSLMKNERGALVGIIGAGMDVTARKRAEQERARLTDILEKTTDYVGIADVKGRATYINKAGRKMLGIDENEDIKNLYIRDFMASSVTENALNKMLLIASKNGAWSGESVIRHRSGTEIPVSQAIVAHKSENGVVEFISAICRDISDRKQAEEELRKKEQHLRAVLENMPVMMIAFDRHKTIIVWNRECERVTGYSAEEIVGNSNVWELLYPDPAYRTQMFDQWQERGNVCRNWEWQLTAKDGNIKTVAWSNISENFPIPGWGGWGIGVDITPRKQTESALQQTSASLQEYATQLEQTLHELQQTQAQLVQTEKMSSLGQLVAGVAHEINNPVNFIYGNLAHAKEYTQDLLNLLALYQQHYPDPPQEIREATEEIDLDFIIEDLPRLLGSMQVGAERICQIVLSLRNFSRLEEAEMKPVDIHEGIESTLLILQNRLKERGEHPGIQVIKEYGNLPEVECYAGQMNQVFMNILANAIDAIEEYNHRRSSAEIQAQPSTIAIRTELKGKRKLELGENTLAVIRISDNGPGMSEDVRSRLFDPFFTTKPVGKGTGLGLAIGYQIVVEKHGGNLQCNSAPGQGAEFVIEIPIRQQVLRTVQGQ